MSRAAACRAVVSRAVGSKGRRSLVGHDRGAVTHQVACAGAVLVGEHLRHWRVEAHLATARLDVVG